MISHNEPFINIHTPCQFSPLINTEDITRMICDEFENGTKELDLSNKMLRELPLQICKLTQLTTLNLSNNQLRTLPAEIGRLINLKELYLHGNHLNTLPRQISQLKQLELLFLGGNRLRKLTPEIYKLNNLRALSLSDNKLEFVPRGLAKLTNLTYLSLRENELSKFPSEICQLYNVSELRLNHNKLRELPAEIDELQNLTKLHLYGNPLPIPPEIMKRTNEPATIIEYYLRVKKQIEEAKVGGGHFLNKAKIVIVGQGGVGKTSLVKRLVENEFEEQESSTKGINIDRWKVTINDEVIELNIWDFGGQEIMHATHQFFLTKRTLYLLVLDARLGEISSRIDYWLELINSFGENSPIIIVSNKTDQCPSTLNQRELKENFPTIKAFVDTSCKSGEGIAKLEKLIITIIDSLTHVRDLIPLEWLAVKNELEGIERDYITYNDYVRLCQNHNIREKKEQHTLIRLLHDLGVVLNFQSVPILRDTIVLNPEWVTNGIYQIINAPEIAQNKGILEIRQLENILKSAELYPKQKHWFIIDLMRKFELCFDLEGHTEERFLIADLLPEKELGLDSRDQSLNFEYHYDFLPGNVISRFMVRMNRFIFQDTYWRNGVVLVHNVNRAVVKGLPRQKKILVSISGRQENRQKFWTMIHSEFNQIHASIKGLNAKVKIAVRKGVTVDYSFLLNLHQKGIETHYVKGKGQDGMVKIDVRELLEGVRAAPKAVEPERAANLKRALEPLRLRVHPQKFYELTFLLGRLYYEEVGDHSYARVALEDGHQAIEALRRLTQDERAQVGLSAESVKLYEMVVPCCVVERQFDKAFEYAAAAKGRSFVNQLAEARIDLARTEAQKPDFAQKLRRARDKRREIKKLESQIGADKQLAPSPAGGAGQIGEEGANRHDLLGQQEVLLREEAELWREMEREHPVLTATLSVPRLEAAEARILAKELGATLVEYYRHTGGWCAFVVTSDGIRYEPLPELDDNLLEELAEWRNEVRLPTGRSPWRLKRLARLYSAAVAPLGLASKRVIMAPFRQLHLLPLSATYYLNRSGEKCYLAEAHTLSYVPSLTALYVVYQEQKRRPSSQGRRPELVALRQAQEPRFGRLLSVAYPGTPPLPNVLEEAKAIADRLADTAVVERLHGKDATPDKVLSRLKEAPHFDVIHFGCHGRFDSRQPTASGLMLAEKPLTIEQIITKLNLKPTRLATLAACLTGEVALREGEEHIGLLQAMMTAGVQTVVASLWAVDDAATRALFEAFYSREATILAPAQAMRDASKLLREVEAWKHPFYWAAFAVNGLVAPNSFWSLSLSKGGEGWPPAELCAKMEIYAQQSTRHRRSQTMSDEKTIENAELLLKDLLDGCQEVWHALQPPYQLSQDVAQQQVVAGELGLAEALHLIVRDNPALHEFASEDVVALRIEPQQHLTSQQPTPSSEKNGQTWNEVSHIFQEFVTVLQQKYESPAKKRHCKQCLLKKVFGRFLPDKEDAH